MIMNEPTQQSMSLDAGNELEAYIERNTRLYNDFKATLNDEARAELEERTLMNEEVYAIYIQAWGRLGAQYYQDAPSVTMKDLEEKHDLHLPNAPLELLAEIVQKLHVLDLDEAVPSDPAAASIHMLGSVYDKVDERLSDAMQGSDVDDGRVISSIAKEITIEKLKVHEQAVGSGRSLDETLGVLTDIYLHTMLSGKKALHYRVADTIENAWIKPIEGYITPERKELLGQLVNLAVQPTRTDENIQTMRDIMERIPPLKNTAKTWIMNAYFSEALRSQARQNTLTDMAQRTRAMLQAITEERIYNLQEESRTVEIFCAIAGIDYSQPIESDETGTAEETVHNYNLQPMELDWEVLPPGESELEKGARQIIEDVSVRTGKRPEIDLNRLNILEGIREQWGKDRSYYSRGVRQKRSVVHDMGGHEQPDEYIILVLQEPDAKTGLVREHVVAESPIAGPNALYVYRPDTTDHRHDWRTVMSLPKDRSRQLGARDVRHTTSKGSRDLNDTMIEKAIHLLTVPPAEFETLKFSGVDKEGSVRVSRTLGRSANHLTR